MISGRHIPATGKALMALLCLGLAACQTSTNPEFKSTYVGKPSADFFLKYGPPSDVIAYDAIPKGADPINYPGGDPKELVYYWSSINERTYTEKKNPKPLKDECNLAILTRADGKILRMEVQSTSMPLEKVKAFCETIVD
jgi:hypothetical protein